MTRRERNIRRGIFFLVVIGLNLLLCGSLQKPKYSVKSYGIGCGDTLWSIAEEYKPNSVTYREYIDLMYKLNDGLTAEIFPGQDILIPVYWD